MRDNINVSGGWLGTYRYGGGGAILPAVRFEATFRALGIDGDQLGGEILDDCMLGAADVEGSQSGTVVRFSKVYHKATIVQLKGPIDYAGLISDDGSVMRGTWQIQTLASGIRTLGGHGTWEAHRQWYAEGELRENEDSVQGERGDVSAVMPR